VCNWCGLSSKLWRPILGYDLQNVTQFARYLIVNFRALFVRNTVIFSGVSGLSIFDCSFGFASDWFFINNFIEFNTGFGLTELTKTITNIYHNLCNHKVWLPCRYHYSMIEERSVVLLCKLVRRDRCIRFHFY
jgi:hypothetical protein